MPRGSATQTRTFNYNSGTTVTGFPQSATNPENGTVTYTYNANNLLASKTDAKRQNLTYQYDSYNRLTRHLDQPSARRRSQCCAPTTTTPIPWTTQDSHNTQRDGWRR